MRAPFRPYPVTKTIAATATSGTVQLTAGGETLRIANAGTKTAFVRVGTGSQTAVTTDMPVLAGQTIIIRKKATDTYAAAICAATETTTVYFSSGDGGE